MTTSTGTATDTANLFKGIVGSLVRAGLGGFTLWLAQHGLITEGQAGALLEASIVGAITVIWAIWNKYKIREKINVALELPQGSSPATLEKELESRKV